MNLLFFKSFSVILSESIATKKVNTKAKIHCHTGMPAKALPSPPLLTRSIISKINPPKIIGMLNKKLYSAALPSSLPASMSDEIVLPDLEMPGRTVNPWTKPTRTALFVDISGAGTTADFLLNIYVENSKIDVIKKQKP